MYNTEVTWEWKDTKINSYDIAVFRVGNYVGEIKLEERKENCWWASFSVKKRGNVSAFRIFSAVADIIEKFVIDRKPKRLSIAGNRKGKNGIYKKTLLERGDKYGYYVEERITPHNEDAKAYTMVLKENN